MTVHYVIGICLKIVIPSSLHSARISKRSASLRRVVGALLLAVQLLASVEVSGHTHHFALRLVSDTALTAHECGANERHIPLTELHPCQFCQQIQMRQFLPVAPDEAVIVAAPVGQIIDGTFAPLTARAFLLPAKRGPPALS